MVLVNCRSPIRTQSPMPTLRLVRPVLVVSITPPPGRYVCSDVNVGGVPCGGLILVMVAIQVPSRVCATVDISPLAIQAVMTSAEILTVVCTFILSCSFSGGLECRRGRMLCIYMTGKRYQMLHARWHLLASNGA